MSNLTNLAGVKKFDGAQERLQRRVVVQGDGLGRFPQRPDGLRIGRRNGDGTDDAQLQDGQVERVPDVATPRRTPRPSPA